MPICTGCHGRWRSSASPKAAPPPAWARTWTARCVSCRVAIAARSNWCARCCTGPAWCLWTSPPWASTPRAAATCARPSNRTCASAAAACCGPPTWSRRPKPPTGCWCCTRANCWPMARPPPWPPRWAAARWRRRSSAPPPDEPAHVHPPTRSESCPMKTRYFRSCVAGLAPAAAPPFVQAQVQAQGVAYVSSEKDNALTIVDLKTLAVTGTLATCKRPRHLQRSADGQQMLVACTDSNQADLIDLATRKSVGKLPLGAEPEAFDLSPDGKTVWVSSEVASLVHVIDTASGKVLKNVKVGKRPRRFALTPDGSQLWVTNELAASVTILSTRDYSTLGTLTFQVKGARAADITPVGITMTRDGKRAFVALGKANHVAFVDVPARKVTDLVLVGKRAWNVTLDTAEARLYVVNGLSDDLTVVDVAAAKALKSIAVGREI